MRSDEEIRTEFPEFRGNAEHLRRLLEGVEAWNRWRTEAPEEKPGLAGLRLAKRDAPEDEELGPLWERTTEEGFYRANLRWANLERATLIGAHLEGAHLGGAHLEGAYLGRAHLEGAHLGRAHLEGANLGRAHLEGADLGRAHLEGANLGRAHLEGAFLFGAHLEGADLRGAHLEGADLGGADLSGADLRIGNPEHLRLDDTRILHSRFAPRSRDPWSVVRSTYSGPSLLFHLLFLLVFLVPYLGRAAYWKGVNAAQGAAAAVQDAADLYLKTSTAKLEALARDPSASEKLEALWRSQGLDIDRAREVFEDETRQLRERVFAAAGVRMLAPVEDLGLCLKPAKDCASPQPIWRPLLGLHRTDGPFPLRFLALVLILYNVCRGFLTYYVSGLRDAELRGGYSPRLPEYIRVYYLHAYFLKWVPIAGLTAAGIHIAEWLLVTDVVLPV